MKIAQLFRQDRWGSLLPINRYFFVLLIENLAQTGHLAVTGSCTVGSNPTLSDRGPWPVRGYGEVSCLIHNVILKEGRQRRFRVGRPSAGL